MGKKDVRAMRGLREFVSYGAGCRFHTARFAGALTVAGTGTDRIFGVYAVQTRHLTAIASPQVILSSWSGSS